ncbi:hypothetical protein LEP1GSC073_3722 [Leptospira noguchii str. Cascata]|nr:hypothetical protein LEP1GSC072_1533 [Leptospira noguchii str. Bonito]EMS88534.1 hypothetical protein LEP1GSC073_3722 [Leptospira noguchii str. Cascata]
MSFQHDLQNNHKEHVLSLNSKKGFVKSSGATTFSFPYIHIQNTESSKVTGAIYIIEL